MVDWVSEEQQITRGDVAEIDTGGRDELARGLMRQGDAGSPPSHE